ncbi:MAG: DUF4340 domain-containing protein [gamma proteobacterium symbiont of Bathyaustriella thionipta]|nr:DUF4340 domain-containing protein [gamma proteobacterium symbiont of Bathyaustriella thionipta]MCU7948939.1 DUF4340 domain-containing protein [gamma proteobacterium symbiont of Bathyaustriella thionipta]MCU7953786.1 DUF4340 domain-containing protein [gamma proteobacterium symbiont of Bathyaustriella thionipta]MCU7955460.1 DUF4340 domain-containing protein [gamma proteobacterium symbiont of Bathyaustriella thionipta]MCU7966413.1 DUF4340 domain-containing protein [gamma proteobacterium symbion
MSREARINLVLFIIVVCLSLLAWYQPGLKKVTIHYLSSLQADDINHIVIERQAIASIKLSKHNNHWFIDEPYQLPANSLRVKTITALVDKRSYSQFQVKEAELSRYQLDEPPISIWLNDKQFVLGSTDPIKQQRYAMNMNDNRQSGNNTVHLINGVIFYQLRAALDTFISPALLPPLAKIKSISWLDKTLTMDDNGWRLIPEAPEVNSDSIAQLIQFWKQVQASKVETNVSLSINNEALIQSKSIVITLALPINEKEDKIEKIQYLIIQDGTQIKLLRTDKSIAYWVSPQILKLITEFLPVPNNTAQ